MRYARSIAHVTLEEWAEALVGAGAPGVTRDQVWNWESGGVIVPAYGLLAATKASHRSLGELLSMGGERVAVEAQLHEHGERLQALEAELGRLRAQLRQWMADRGLPDLPDFGAEETTGA